MVAKAQKSLFEWFHDASLMTAEGYEKDNSKNPGERTRAHHLYTLHTVGTQLEENSTFHRPDLKN